MCMNSTDVSSLAHVPLNQMQATGGFNNATHLAGLEGKRGVLELLLHVTAAKVAQIAALSRRGAVGLSRSKVAQRRGAGLDLCFVGLDDLHGLFFGAGDVGLAPRAGAAGVAVLDEQMGGADLVLWDAGDSTVAGASAVVGGHVVLEFLAVGSGGRFPTRDLFLGVEVVGQVLGVGVTNLPVGGETGISLMELCD